MSKTYEDGLNEAWGAARRLKNEFTLDERKELFGYYAPFDTIDTLTPQEVIEKLEKYDKYDGIVVGDEVVDENGWGIKGVITKVNEKYISVVQDNGSVSRWEKEHFKKTGRHFPEIEEVLKQMQEGEA